MCMCARGCAFVFLYVCVFYWSLASAVVTLVLSIWVAFPFLFFGKISVSRDGSSIPHGPWGWSWSTAHL